MYRKLALQSMIARQMMSASGWTDAAPEAQLDEGTLLVAGADALFSRGKVELTRGDPCDRFLMVGPDQKAVDMAADEVLTKPDLATPGADAGEVQAWGNLSNRRGIRHLPGRVASRL